MRIDRGKWMGALIVLGLGCASGEAPRGNATPVVENTNEAAPEAAEAPEAPEGTLTRVEPSLVCMINDQFMGSPQIPVAVEGRTYFGCCAMCERRLRDDATSRLATDPVTGRQVDKASAVIGRASDGRVHYFESEDSMRRFPGA
jgi:YHS domain-containing protein